MSVIETKTFKSGNSVAVRLPRELGLAAGTPVRIERVGDRLEIRPAVDPTEEKHQLREMLDEIRRIWADAPAHPDRGKREPIEFPDRHGLY